LITELDNLGKMFVDYKKILCDKTKLLEQEIADIRATNELLLNQLEGPIAPVSGIQGTNEITQSPLNVTDMGDEISPQDGGTKFDRCQPVGLLQGISKNSGFDMNSGCEEDNSPFDRTSFPPVDNVTVLEYRDDLGNIENSDGSNGDDDARKYSDNDTSPVRNQNNLEEELAGMTQDGSYNEDSTSSSTSKRNTNIGNDHEYLGKDCKDLLNKEDKAGEGTKKRLAKVNYPNKKARTHDQDTELTPKAIKIPTPRPKMPRKTRKTLKPNQAPQGVFQYTNPHFTFRKDASSGCKISEQSQLLDVSDVDSQNSSDDMRDKGIKGYSLPQKPSLPPTNETTTLCLTRDHYNLDSNIADINNSEDIFNRRSEAEGPDSSRVAAISDNPLTANSRTEPAIEAVGQEEGVSMAETGGKKKRQRYKIRFTPYDSKKRSRNVGGKDTFDQRDVAQGLESSRITVISKNSTTADYGTKPTIDAVCQNTSVGQNKYKMKEKLAGMSYNSGYYKGRTSSSVTSPLPANRAVPKNNGNYHKSLDNIYALSNNCEDMLNKGNLGDEAPDVTRKRLAEVDLYDPNKKAKLDPQETNSLNSTPKAIEIPTGRPKKTPRRIGKTSKLKRNSPGQTQDDFKCTDFLFRINSGNKSTPLLPADEAVPSIADSGVELTGKAVCHNEGKFKCSDYVTCHKHL
jgi:hypothetical protein